MLRGTPHTFVGSTTFTVGGMSCAHCRHVVAQAVAAVPGVGTVTVDLAAQTATVTATGAVDRADIAAAVENAGYTLEP